MPVCYIYRQQEGRQAELPKGRRDFKMATLDVTEKVNVLVDALGWESFCEELMERMERSLQGSTTSTFPGGGSSAITDADAATRDEAGMTWGKPFGRR